MKSLLSFTLLFSLITTSAYGSSYMDKQLKSSKHAKKYSSIKIHTQANKIKKDKTSKNIKDPKLIKLSNIKKINDAQYSAKLKQDEIGYQKSRIELSTKKENAHEKDEIKNADLYNLYEITEKIIRANKLDYVNWRVALYKETTAFNAYTTSANLIAVYTALYDSLYGNNDAIAFVISHELSHQILGHAQRTMDLKKKLRTWVSENESGMLDSIYYKKLRDMEFEADAEALTLLKKAGYSEEKALDAMNFIEALPNYKTIYSSHPQAKDRKKSLMELVQYLNPSWVDEGKANIYSSNVLTCKKSSDKISFVILGNNKQNAYTPETYEQRLLRYAYLSYLKGDNKKAIKYFEKLTREEEKYEYYLYLSYAWENLFKETQKENRLEKAIENAQIALNLSNNQYTNKQVEDLAKL